MKWGMVKMKMNDDTMCLVLVLLCYPILVLYGSMHTLYSYPIFDVVTSSSYQVLVLSHIRHWYSALHATVAYTSTLMGLPVVQLYYNLGYCTKNIQDRPVRSISTSN